MTRTRRTRLVYSRERERQEVGNTRENIRADGGKTATALQSDVKRDEDESRGETLETASHINYLVERVAVILLDEPVEQFETGAPTESRNEATARIQHKNRNYWAVRPKLR